MVDAGDLKSPSRKGVLVRVQPSAPHRINELQRFGEMAWSPKNGRLCQNCVSSRIGLGVRHLQVGTALNSAGACNLPKRFRVPWVTRQVGRAG